MKGVVVRLAVLFLVLPCVLGFAAGEKESGREAGYEAIAAGQFINPTQIDSVSYLDDFPVDIAPDPARDLSVAAMLEKPLVLRRGDRVNLQITLLSNTEAFYPRQDANYVVFFHDPGLLLYADGYRAAADALREIRGAMGASDKLGVFSIVKKQILLIRSVSDVPAVLDGLKAEKKTFQKDQILASALESINAIQDGNRTCFVWVTDEDLLKVATDTRLMSFSLKLYAQNRTWFTYVGYGENPMWATMNASLMDVGGNSYYADSYDEIKDILVKDYRAFSHPAVEDVRITVSFYPYVKVFANDYRDEWYPAAKSLRPTTAFYDRPTGAHFVKSMDSGTHKVFLHYLGIDPQNITFMNEFLRERGYRDTIPVAYIGVEYYSHRARGKRYVSQELSITYTDDWTTYERGFSPTVQRSTILQNTPYIEKELSTLISVNRDYQTAILLLDNQITRLKALPRMRDDGMIDAETSNLENYKDLLVKQARSLNYIK